METSKEKLTIKEKRDNLKRMTDVVKPLVNEGKYEKLNEGIISEFYRNETHTEFKTFHQWQAEGKRVKKGETAFYVWAKPLSAQAEAQGKTFDGERDYFPLCFLFSNAQVEEMKKMKQAA